MHHHSDDELGPEAAARRRLVARRRRCLQTAAALYLPAVAAVLFLCVWGLRPAAVAVPTSLTAVALLLGSASAVMFARLAHLKIAELDDGSDEDDDGPGGGSGNDPEPPADGGLEVDWDGFERDFRSYCERGRAALV